MIRNQKPMKFKLFTVGTLLALSLSAQCALYTFNGPFNDNGNAGDGVIPDNSYIGLRDAQTLSGLETSISTVILKFTFSGGFGSDLNGYLRLGNLENSPAYDLTTYLGTLGNIPVTDTEYTVDVSSSFVGMNPNNSWTLFFSDPSAGGQTTMASWSLDITAVPEPTTWAAIGFGLIFGMVQCVHYARRRKSEISA